jgi:hypothetical protein
MKVAVQECLKIQPKTFDCDKIGNIVDHWTKCKEK